MATIIWSEEALFELRHIAEYIELDNPIAATKLVKTIFQKADALSTFPLLGRPLTLKLSSVYHVLYSRPVQVIYRIQDDLVFIVHVFREEQEMRFESNEEVGNS